MMEELRPPQQEMATDSGMSHRAQPSTWSANVCGGVGEGIKTLTGKLLTRLTSKLIIRRGPVGSIMGLFLAQSCCSDVAESARLHQQTTSRTELRPGLLKMVGSTPNELRKCYSSRNDAIWNRTVRHQIRSCSNRILYEKSWLNGNFCPHQGLLDSLNKTFLEGKNISETSKKNVEIILKELEMNISLMSGSFKKKCYINSPV